jgi:hypothetical protein
LPYGCRPQFFPYTQQKGRLNDRLIKPSLFIPENYIGGFPHLYKSMLSDDLFSIEILDSLDECAKCLSVDKKLLEDAVK